MWGWRHHATWVVESAAHKCGQGPQAGKHPAVGSSAELCTAEQLRHTELALDRTPVKAAAIP